MKDGNGGGKIEMLRLITPGLLAILSLGVAYLLTQQSTLVASVQNHHEQDIERRESMDLFVTKAEVKECIRRLDEKIDLVLVAVKDLKDEKK